MAIYHFSAKIISRANGSSALAAAAYRSASRLHDERLDRHHDFSNKAGVVHSEVMLPDGAPEHLSDRQKLWNAVEAAEKRIDAQLAREVEFALPRELSKADAVELAREFVKREFVTRGMVADLNVHWDIGADGLAKPHAHVMLTTRSIGEDGFGPKVRDWNRADLLEAWRERWAEHVNHCLAEHDIDARVDHRSLDAQGIDLEPQHKIGPAAARMERQGLDVERVAEHREIARANGAKLLADPRIALDAITHSQATFTTRDLAKFVHRHSDGKDQFDHVMAAVRASPELVKLGIDGRGEDRFTSREMLRTEIRLEQALDRLGGSVAHSVPEQAAERILARSVGHGIALGAEQEAALRHVVSGRDLGIIVGYAGTGKSMTLGLAREAWEAAGYTVRGAALSGIAAEGLEAGSSIASRTLTSLEHQWSRDRNLLTDRDVLVIDEAGMIGSRQMERVLTEAQKRGAKVVLVGDPEQLQAIEAGAAFRSAVERYGHVEITAVRRQREGWQQQATRQLATGRTGQALDAYTERGLVRAAPTREAAQADLIDHWDAERRAAPEHSRIILTHTNDDVRTLNDLARNRLQRSGDLGHDVDWQTGRGGRHFATGDRIMFLRNERELGVKNGTLGRIDSVTAARMTVMLDDGRTVGFDAKDYRDVDHGYAATIHKAQGMTVDRVHVLATPGLDRHAAYVALSRHRDSVLLYYGQDDFADPGRLTSTLSRERGKDMAQDHLRSQAPVPAVPMPARTTLRDPLPDAVVRHAHIIREMRASYDWGDAYTPAQRQELIESRSALDRIHPNAARDLESALSVNTRLIGEAADGRPANAVRAMAFEARLRVDPQLRADTFVQRWQALDRQRRLLLRDHETSRADKLAGRMMGMAKSLERDPQVESILRSRRADLGLPKTAITRVGQSLSDVISVTRTRGLGLGV